MLFLVKSHNDRVDVAVLTLQDDKIVHHEIFDGVLLGVQGENVLLVASGAGAWHVVTSSNPVWLKR
ncbi:MAG TPA: hypothetical protein VHC22_33980 [Pirellulales bacterium]|nr:hypothetical protein [Pirellulales bacterium]